EETAFLLKRSDAFFNVRSAKSCDAAKLDGKSRPAAPATPVARKLLRVQESGILRISNESSGSAEYTSTRQEEAFAPITRGKRLAFIGSAAATNSSRAEMLKALFESRTCQRWKT